MSTRSGDSLDAAQFPALADFVAGYLHQDFASEHATPAGAARAFLADASAVERQQLRAECEEFLAAAARRPWRDVRVAFDRLGGAWMPRTRAELASLFLSLRTTSPAA